MAEDTAIRESIAQGELPTDTSAIPAPNFVKAALDLCWDLDPELRGGILWYKAILSKRVTDVFSILAELPFEDVPARWRSHTPGCNVVYNPNSTAVYQVESGRSFGDAVGLR